MPKAERIDRAFRAEHLRKLHPKLLMILNGGGVVNQLRAERCASITVGSIDATLDPLREPGARSARADFVQALADDQWEDPRRGGDDVLVDVFIRLCESGAERDPAKWKRVELTGACNELLTATLPLSCLSALSEDPAVNAVEIAERVDFFPPFNVQVVAGAERKAATPGASAGSGVVIGIIDVGGFDFAHLAFLDDEGETRFVEIWDQAGDTRPHPEGFGYGARITRRHMQRAIDAWRHGKSNGLLPWCTNTGKSLIPLTLLFFAQKRNLLIPLELSRVMHQGTDTLVFSEVAAGFHNTVCRCQVETRAPGLASEIGIVGAPTPGREGSLRRSRAAVEDGREVQGGG